MNTERLPQLKLKYKLGITPYGNLNTTKVNESVSRI